MGAASSRAERIAAGTRVLLQEKLSAGKISASEYQHMIAVLNRGDRTWSSRAAAGAERTSSAAVLPVEGSGAVRVAVAALSAAMGADAALQESLLGFGVTHDRLLQHFFNWQHLELVESPAPLTMDEFLASAFAVIAEHDPLGAEDVGTGAEMSADADEEGLERTVEAARAVAAFAERLWADVGNAPLLPASSSTADGAWGAGDERRASRDAVDGTSPSGGRAKSQRLSQFLLMRKRRAEGEAAAAAAAAAPVATSVAAPPAAPPATSPAAVAHAGSEEAVSGAAVEVRNL